MAVCPCCTSRRTTDFRVIDGHAYFRCRRCRSLFLDPAELDAIDAGASLVKYGDAYWAMELPPARERAYGVSLVRAAEALHYCRRPVQRFLDVGTGPGLFLDAVARHLPASAEVFYGIEKHPPPPSLRSTSPRYLVGSLRDLDFRVDCGLCMEVLEHLTPNMARALFSDLAAVSREQALYLFNTGLPRYVLDEDPAYLDPTRRGHIVSYSLAAVARLAGPAGFQVYPIRSKSWAFAIELGPRGPRLHKRIWDALPENLRLLQDPEMGSVLRIAGLETARVR